MLQSLVPQTGSGPSAAAPETVARRNGVATFFHRIARGVPTLLVLIALGGLGYWGHHTGWKLKKFSEFNGTGPAAADDWCEEHRVVKSDCVVCNSPSLAQKKSRWCKQHGVHECPWEHPEVAKLPKPPIVSPADLERAQRALAFAKRAENDPKCPFHARPIQLASQEVLDRQGIDLDAVWRARIEEKVTANGEITYDQTRVASLSTPVPGKVWRVEKEIGQHVKKDDVLALIDAAEVGKVKADFLQGLVQVDLKDKTLANLREAGKYVNQRQVDEAEAALREAHIRVLTAQQALVNLGLPIRAEEVKGLKPEEIARRVQFLGLPEAITRTLDPNLTTTNLLPIRAPLDGVVVSRKPEAVAGQVVDASKTLFVVADTRQMWLTLHVRLEDARYLDLGQTVRFRRDGSTEEAAGKVTWISPAVDEKTRTVEVRAELANPAGQLRANTFGVGTVVLRTEEQAVVVPNAAIHSDGKCNVLFVYDKNSSQPGAPKIFHPRSVRLGAKDGENTEIIAGVLPGEMVATKNSGTLRSELLKNRLGEG